MIKKKELTILKLIVQLLELQLLDWFYMWLQPTYGMSNSWMLKMHFYMELWKRQSTCMLQPPDFVDPQRPDYLCKLKKAIYSLKQAPRVWCDKLNTFLLDFGLTCSLPDPSIFVYINGKDMMYLLVYVDDMILIGSNDDLI